MVGDYYASFMDEAAIEAAGLAPLRPTLDSIAAISNRTQLAYFLGTTLRADVDAINATRPLHRQRLRPLGRAGPRRSDPVHAVSPAGRPRHAGPRATTSTRRPAWPRSGRKYQAHVAGDTRASPGSPARMRKAAAIVAARDARSPQAHWTREATGDVAKGNNHWTAEGLPHQARPGLDWDDLLRRGGARRSRRTSIVWQPSAVTGLSALTTSGAARRPGRTT